jgi:hypothetical protein
MAQDSIMANLFGVSPEIYEQNRQEQTRRQAIEFAQLDPYERTNAMAYIGGRGLGNIVGGALGAQDPVMRLMSQRAELGQQFDLSTPQGFKSLAKELLAKNDPQGAQIALQKGSDLELRESQITKNLQERRAASLGSDVMKANAEAGIKSAIRQLEAQEQTPDVVSALQVYKDQLTALTRPKEYAPSEISKLMNERAQLDPVKDKEAYDILTNRMKKLSTEKSLGESIGEGLGLLGRALAPALKKEGEETGKFSAENFNKLGSAVAAGTSSQRNLATLENALTNAFTGKFAESKEGVITSLTALGIPVGSDLKDAASNTQLIQAMGTRYVFPLVKNFPGSLAAKELDRLEKTAPNALQQPETIQRLVNLMKVDLAENKYTYDRAKEHKEKNKTLINFNEADSRIEFQTKLNKLQDLVSGVRRKKSKTKEEDQQINSLKSELGL